MSKIFVSGLANIETTCAVREFPIAYSPIEYNFFGVQTAASGVGLNVSLALSALGDRVSFRSFAADDPAGKLVRSACADLADCRIASADQTPQSVVLFDQSGRRRVYTDLKDIQERRLPPELYADVRDFDAFCLCNINFSRDILPAAKAVGKPVCCDVHCLSDIRDEYNADFMRYADVLFLSNEYIIDRERAFVLQLAAEYPCKIIVVGMGARGALLYEREHDRFTMVDSVYTRPVVNTVGAGDALFSAFVHFYVKGEEAVQALRLACRFASYMIGESGAAKGFLDESSLLRIDIRRDI